MMCPYGDIEQIAPACVIIFVLLAIFIALTVLSVKAIIYCMIFSKAGYSWALGLLMLVPIANIIMPFILAFSDWPIQKELRQLKQPQGNTPA